MWGWIPLIPLLFRKPSGSRQNHPLGLTLGVSVLSRVFPSPPSTKLLGTVHPGFLGIWLHPVILSRLLLYSWSQGRGKGHRLRKIFNMGGGSSNWEWSGQVERLREAFMGIQEAGPRRRLQWAALPCLRNCAFCEMNMHNCRPFSVWIYDAGL